MTKHVGVGGGVIPAAGPTSYEHYETPACATRALLEAERGNLPWTIWEPCAGKGAISRVIAATGRTVFASDILAYEGADAGIERVDFLLTRRPPSTLARVIVTNFPFAHNDTCIDHGLDLSCKVYCLMRWAWAEGVDGEIRGSGLRSKLVDKHLTHVWLGRERLPMMHREGYDGPKLAKGAVPYYAWFCFTPTPSLKPGFRVRRISWGK